MKPLAIDIFCGLGGWAEGFLAEGWDVVGFDIERHDYGTGGYPGQLVLQDVLTLHGSQFKHAAAIVASPPCQKYSYMAMPWTRAKKLAEWYRDPEGQPDRINELTALFDACFRIQREASEAAGQEIPMVVENVKGAQPWVGWARWHFGSFYLWGDVPAIMPFSFYRKLPASVSASIRAGKSPARWTNPAEHYYGRKVPSMNGWDGYGKPGYKPQGFNVEAARRYRELSEAGKGMSGSRGLSRPTCREKRDLGGPNDPRRFSSRSDSRKAASAAIAKIPFPLAQHIARVFKPHPNAAQPHVGLEWTPAAAISVRQRR